MIGIGFLQVGQFVDGQCTVAGRDDPLLAVLAQHAFYGFAGDVGQISQLSLADRHRELDPVVGGNAMRGGEVEQHAREAGLRRFGCRDSQPATVGYAHLTGQGRGNGEGGGRPLV
nr:hypothetical protein [Actinomadura soli]